MMFNKIVRGLFVKSEQRWLNQMAAAGFVLGILSVICLLLQKTGLFFDPGLRVDKAASLLIAFGIFLSTTSLVLPITGLSFKARARFQKWLSVAVYYGYADELIQVFRGVDPRFGKGDFLTNVLPGIIDGALFGCVILLYMWLMLQFFTLRSYRTHPLLVLGIRYGLLACMVGFGSGIWMVVNQGRFTGENGNIMTVHFLGFHGLQAAPVLALLLARCMLSARVRRGWLHAAGMVWLVLSAYSFVPTYLGRSLLHVSDLWVLPVWILLVLWAVLALQVFTMFVRSRSETFKTQQGIR